MSGLSLDCVVLDITEYRALEGNCCMSSKSCRWVLYVTRMLHNAQRLIRRSDSINYSCCYVSQLTLYSKQYKPLFEVTIATFNCTYNLPCIEKRFYCIKRQITDEIYIGKFTLQKSLDTIHYYLKQGLKLQTCDNSTHLWYQ